MLKVASESLWNRPNLGSYHSNIPVDTFRGFALADDIAPLAVINDNDAASARSFTALHEVVHLWLGDTGVSGWTTELAAEQYCSDVAALILLDPRELGELRGIRDLQLEDQVERITRFAHLRRISRAMVAYRLLCTQAITRKNWGELRTYFRDAWLAHKEREALKKANKEGGPSYYVVRRHRIGKALLNLAGRSLGEGLLSYTRAARLLGVKARNVGPLLFGNGSTRGGS
jgi:Zn-dependent peptidase ImmA (M78 family)